MTVTSVIYMINMTTFMNIAISTTPSGGRSCRRFQALTCPIPSFCCFFFVSLKRPTWKVAEVKIMIFTLITFIRVRIHTAGSYLFQSS